MEAIKKRTIRNAFAVTTVVLLAAVIIIFAVTADQFATRREA